MKIASSAAVSERTREGLAAARKRGRIGGRPPALTPDQKEEVRKMRGEQGRSLREIAKLFRVSTQTIRRLPVFGAIFAKARTTPLPLQSKT